jgi:hypothetical protein
MDLEGIVSDAEGGFYLCDERNSGVRYAHPVKEIFDVLPLKWPDSENMNHWKNRGLEGIALDVKTNRLFLAKERQPQKLFEVDADGFQVQQIAQQITEASQFDISDLFYENGFLYLLNRAGFRILKMDLETSDVTDTLDYRRVMFHNQTLMYAGARYAMAEALIFNEQEIWIGLDNNAEPVNSDNKWMKMYNFEGTNPVIVVIERPEGF